MERAVSQLRTAAQKTTNDTFNNHRFRRLAESVRGRRYFYPRANVIAGSHTLQDWVDDVTKLPVWGDLKNSTRYKAAEEVIKENVNISRVVGHSFGGSVALELDENFDQIKHSRTYGAPVWNLAGDEKETSRYRNWFDPVSIFDRSAQTSVNWNPFESASLTHDFTNIADNVQTADLVK